MRGDHGRAYARPHLVLFTALRMSAKPIAASSCRMLAPPQRDRLLNSRQNPFIQTRSRADWAIPSRRPRSGSRPFSTARIRLIRGVLGYVFSILRDCRRSSRRRRRSFTASLFGHCGSPYFRTWPRPPGAFSVSPGPFKRRLTWPINCESELPMSRTTIIWFVVAVLLTLLAVNRCLQHVDAPSICADDPTAPACHR